MRWDMCELPYPELELRSKESFESKLRKACLPILSSWAWELDLLDRRVDRSAQALFLAAKG
jgi:hypothetical protein